jgi:AAA+ superfamily predicted ATPase
MLAPDKHLKIIFYMTKKSLIELTIEVYEFIILKGFSNDMTSLDSTLDLISKECSISNFESIIYALAYQRKLRKKLFDITFLSETFENSPKKLKEAKFAVKELVNKGLFLVVSDSEKSALYGKTNPNVCPVDKSIFGYNSKSENTLYLVLRKIIGLSDPSAIYSDYKEIENQFITTLSKNKKIPMIKLILSNELSSIELYFLIHLIWNALRLSNKIALDFFINDLSIFTNVSEINFLQNVLSGKSKLIVNKLIRKITSKNYSDYSFQENSNQYYQLSEEFISELKRLNIVVPSVDCSSQDDSPVINNTFRIIEPNKISDIELYYSENELKYLKSITTLLQNRQRFNEVIEKLKSNSISRNISILLFGSPGTGKTEWVKQMARESSRRIMQVEISQVRSKWLGETEKIIKDIFREYETFKQKCTDTPILLLNEADAIISKRFSISSSNRSKVENNIQNILLEEIENFDGIIVATTNIVENFDKAFERRFLYKVEISLPDVNTRSKIWNSKIPVLTQDECYVLSQKFNFSGGQIENIMRKSFIDSLTENGETTFESIIELCEQEEIVITMPRKRIGFNRLCS